ncbi:DUF4886 domain-containing protein [Cerasicoccus maritimus]|uniref:DUF4886 domain-containing protein n=1 Tax=Cerasicoccus maritimus TaxID=490089 RepID=UPI002852D347|nr:hypothetical protein [Cerasicoccus maritimus]
MKKIFYRARAAVLLVFALASVARAENKVLFLGNSFTIGGGGTRTVPAIFDALARAGGQEDPTTVMAAVGGKDYKYHYESHQTQIASQQWTHVVMQNYSTEPTHVGNVTEHMTYGALLYGSVMANNPNTQVRLYQTWARSAIHSMITGTSTSSSFESTDEMLNELVTNYQALADTINADNPANPPVKVNPVGQAWNNAGGNLDPSDPGYIDLFATDEYHGNWLGYYLSACVHYASIYQASPEGLYGTPEIAALSMGLNTTAAAHVESIAWQTVVAAGLAEEADDTTPPGWTNLAQVDRTTLTLQFDDLLDETSAVDPANYTIINRGKRIQIESIEITGMGNSITITTATELVGNLLVEVSTGLLDDNGNAPTDPIRKSLQAAESETGIIYLDFGGAATVSGTDDTWNQVVLTGTARDAVGNGTGAPEVMLGDLLDLSGASTGITLTMTDAPSSTNNYGTTSGPYPSGATSDCIYGSNGLWSGYTDNSQAVFVFSNLDPGVAYDFTFFASRLSVSDNREAEYRLVGANSGSAALDAADNVSNVAQVVGILPDASGNITLTVAEGANNDNGNGFYYIGAVEIDTHAAVEAPVLYCPVLLGSNFIVDWAGSGTLYFSTDMSDWAMVEPQPTPPFEDTIPAGGNRFYRIEY